MTDEKLAQIGRGDWLHFELELETVLDIARSWGVALAGVDRPWLCWHVDPDWCLVQQDLVLAAGWTPLVGGDPRFGRPVLRPGAVWHDFNARLRLPVMAMRFPLEFAWLWAPDRLAFWQSDLIVRPVLMRALAASFLALEPGATAAVARRSGWHGLWRVRRYLARVGCTTAEASGGQWRAGTGWWRHFARHPNAPPAERYRRERQDQAHGRGIRHWERHCDGFVQSMPECLVEEGHCPALGLDGSSGPPVRAGVGVAPRWVLAEVCHHLEIPFRGPAESWAGQRATDLEAGAGKQRADRLATS